MSLNPAVISMDMLAIGSDSGVVNLYDDPAATGSSLNGRPTLRRAIMNLVSSLLSLLIWNIHYLQLYHDGPIDYKVVWILNPNPELKSYR